MKTLLNVIRTVLGWIVVFFDYVTRPSSIERSPQEQQEVERQLEDLALYQFYGCPFCVKVRRAAHRLNLPLEYRDARNDDEYRSELEREGGEVQVPCLKIDRGDRIEWLYESDDIVDFLETKFGSAKS